MLIPSRGAGEAIPAAWSIPLALAMLLLTAASPSRAFAVDINVLTVRALKPLLLDITRPFQTKTGNTLTISSDSPGGVTARVTRGEEEIDLVVLPTATMDALAAQGKIVADTVAPVARSGIGVVVKKGELLPDISTVEAFKSTMLAVRSFAYIDPESVGGDGTDLANLFDRLGIASAIQRKAVLVPFGQVAARVDNGEAAMALQQINELQTVQGVTLVGPLPKELQFYTVYAAGVPVAARLPMAAKALLVFLRGDGTTPAVTARGFERP
jgi:molybdate transport system substrate-binding protein